MNLRRLVISAALLAALGAFVGHAPSQAPEAAGAASLPDRAPAPLR
ncbi:MAG TPA: hypothetical protein VMR23_17945 [Candidatus Limnocylindria bacterium]|nr:hypothetical protein [Candidatus Limnocylindria bacterium]